MNTQLFTTALCLTTLAAFVPCVRAQETRELDARQPDANQRALAIQQRRLGTDHPDTARTLAVLGGFHQAHGDLRTAEPFFRRAFEIRERTFGPEHPLTLDLRRA